MDDLKSLNLLVQGGSFGVLVLLVVIATRFIIKRIEQSDVLRALEAKAREVEAAAREAAAKTLKEAVVEQERAQTARVERLIEAQKGAIVDLNTAHAAETERVLAAHAAHLRYEREACEKRHDEVQAEFQAMRKEGNDDRQKQYELIREIAHSLRDMRQVQANERAIQKVKRQRGDPPPEESR